MQKDQWGDPKQLDIFIQSIRYTVDNLLDLQKIIVYSASSNDEKILKIFDYAIKMGIDVVVPDNMLQMRNRLRGRD